MCSAGKNQGSFCVLREKIKGVFEIIMCQNLHNRQQNHSKKKAKLIEDVIEPKLIKK